MIDEPPEEEWPVGWLLPTLIILPMVIAIAYVLFPGLVE